MPKETIRVLLIEDDPMVQEINRQFIERVAAFQVVGTATDGSEGIRKVQELHPDLVILDIYMPSQDGLETLHQIRKEKQTVDVIVVTAANDRKTIRTALQYGAIDYIIKPFQFARIKQSLENYRTYYRQTRGDGEISQGELDRLLYGGEREGRLELPKGLNEVTLKQVLFFLMKQDRALSAEEVAEGVGIARVTARRYLDYLQKVGRVELDVQYGGVGRPVNRYFLREKAAKREGGKERKEDKRQVDDPCDLS
ncbi:two-component system response regulator DctR [Bacillaceae bacterium]